LIKTGYKNENRHKYKTPSCVDCTRLLRCKLKGTEGYLFINLEDYVVIKDAKSEFKSTFGKEQYRLRGNKCESPIGYIIGFFKS
jgi:hypothetical protein